MNALSISPQVTKQLYAQAENENLSVEGLLERWLDLDLVQSRTDLSYRQVALLQQVSDAVIATDRKLIITAWNKAAETIYGWTEAEALGQGIDYLLKTEWVAETQSQAETALADTGLWRGEVRQQTKDGRLRCIWALVSWIKNSEGQIVGGITVNRDITEHKRAEEALRHQNKFLTILHRITLDLLNRRNTPDLLQSIVDHAAIIMDAPYAEIMFVEGDELVVQTCTANQSFVIGDRAKRSEATLAWQAYDTSQVVTIDDYASFPAHRAIYESPLIHAVACFPIMVGQNCLGVLDLSRSVSNDLFTPEQIQQGMLFSQLIAVLLDNAHLHETAAQEITQRRQAEATLRQSETRLRSLIESQTMYVIRTDLNGCFSYVNDATYDRFGWRYADIDHMIGANSLETILPEDHHKTFETVMACMQEPGKPVSVILRKSTPDGSFFSALWEFVALTDATGAPNEIQCMGIDITETLEVRQQLQIKESALQAAANAIVITDPNGVIEWANPAFTTLTGYTLEEVQGKKTSFLNSGVQDGAFFRDLWNTVLSGQIWQGELINKRKDGSLYTEEQTITPVCDSSGRVSHFIAIKQDITERKQAEQIRLDQEGLKASLRKEQEFNAIIQKAVSALSHDVRTPLTVISNDKEMLSHYFDRIDENKRREKLDSIGKQLRYVLEILDDTTLVVKGSLNQPVFKPTPVNLAALCQLSINEIQVTTGLKHHLRFMTDGYIQTVRVDQTLVSRILLNLLSNAVKFSPEASDIRLELSHRDDWIILRVGDQGIGIAEEDQQHIFEPFYRADAVRAIGGTGLGLNIVKDCVERHQGHIHLASQLGKGTVFTIELPLVEA